MDDGSYIIKPKDPSVIVRLQDPTVIERILENPLPVLAELVTAYIETGNGFWAGFGTRLAQAALKGRVFEQFGREFKQLRDRGRIPDDFVEEKYGYKSWVELLTILHEEIPDEDRLEALSAMSIQSTRLTLRRARGLPTISFFRFRKKLTSGQLLLLRVAHERATEKDFKPVTSLSTNRWLEMASQRLGHKIPGLVEQDERVLMQNGLLTGRSWADESGVNDGNGRLTALAFEFCKNLKTYRTDLEAAEPE